MTTTSRARRSSISIAIAAAAACATFGILTQQSVSAQTGYQEYVSLGDSFAAGANFLPPPATDQAPAGCFQRADNYPRQVAAALGVAVHRDATCSGATLAHLAGSQNTGLGTNQPQFNRLSATTDLVTIGFGANDSALGTEAGVACISLFSFPSASCKTATDNAIGRIPAIEANFVAAIGQIQAISPNAQIFVVNYLAAFPSTGCWPLVPVNNTDMGRIKTAWDGLNAMMGRVANTTGVHFVDINSQSGGHDMCKGATVRWVEGLFPISINGGPALQTPLHPNTAGTNAQASFVINAVSAVAPLTATALAIPETTEVPPTEPPATTPPPATEPATTAPPATEPATTAPPATEPPATEPPTTEPPATEAPATTAAP